MVVISVFSGKGGVGKTTLTSNLAAALVSVFNRRTIILDANVTSSHIRLHFGLYENMKKNLEDVIKDEKIWKKAVYRSDFVEVDIIPSPETLKGLDLENLKKLATELAKSEYDFVIIDTPPGFRENVENIVRASDRILLITNPFLPDVTDLLKLLSIINKHKKEVLVVVNRVKGKKFELTQEQIKRMLDIEDVFIVPEDEKVQESISVGVPLVIFDKLSKASISIKKIAAYLINEEYKPSISERIKYFFGL